MNKLFLIATALVSIATSPVIARETRPASAPSDTQMSGTSRTDAAAPRYCMVDTPTGSRIAKKICLTRKQWIDEQGTDPLAKN